MAYMPGESTQTPEQRRAEANRLLNMLEELDIDSCTITQQKFLNDMFADILQPISREQLLWLRDIKDRLL